MTHRFEAGDALVFLGHKYLRAILNRFGRGGLGWGLGLEKKETSRVVIFTATWGLIEPLLTIIMQGLLYN